MNVLEAKGLYFSYSLKGTMVPVIFDFDLKVQKGEFLAVQGASGSGKSTLLYLLGGFLKPQSGKVEVLGKDLVKMQNLELAYYRSKSLGFVFQQFHLLSQLNVIENIALAGEYPIELLHQREWQKEKAKKIAQKIGLSNVLNHKPHQLSGGEQQRVAIARALFKTPEVILADEPTGNLDSKSADQVFQLFKKIQAQGKTIVIVTHSHEIAKKCDRIARMKDGRLLSLSQRKKTSFKEKVPPPSLKSEQSTKEFFLHSKDLKEESKSTILKDFSEKTKMFFLTKLKLFLNMLIKTFPLCFSGLRQNKIRSLLTMIGISIGIASVFSIFILGEVAKSNILKTYENMGVNKAIMSGYKNWNLKAKDILSREFTGFHIKEDLRPLKNHFSEIHLLSPMLIAWQSISIHFGSYEMQEGVRTLGVNEHYLKITNGSLIEGKNFSPFHIKNQSSVCLIGFQIKKRIFKNISPLKKLLTLESPNKNFRTFFCQVIGVLRSQSSNRSWENPDKQVLLPHTLYTKLHSLPYGQGSRYIALQARSGTGMEEFSKALRRYFENKYGKGGKFFVDKNIVMVSQLKRFLKFFQVLLGSIAMISLLVGGIGITNMMLASLSERLRDIGLRKSLGATDLSLQYLYLLESLILCLIAGFFGLLFGFFVCQILIYLISNFSSKLEFQWAWNLNAFVISCLSLFPVGILSGMIPSLKAKKLQVIEALKNN